MPDDIATIVDAARVRGFVGRSEEVACFRAAIGGASSARVLFVHGPGGLGKSALLQQFRILAGAAGSVVVSVDGEDIGPAQDALLDAVAAGGASAAGAVGGPLVVLIDGYERLTALDGWIRDRLVASLPSRAVVVIAGREAPAAPWRTDPGWRAVTASLPLDPLDDAESRLLLVRAGVAEDRCPRLADLGRGHPLTLAMLASAMVAGDLPNDLADAPDLVAALAGRLVDDAPDEDHALAMALCAHAWLTTADLVDEAVGRHAPEVWTWLETRPWITRGTYGIYPHDLVRDVLDADLRRRSPATYRRVNALMHEHSWLAMRSEDEAERRLWAHQKLFLHRSSPLAAAFWTMRTQGAAFVAAGRPADHAGVLAMIDRSLGERTAMLARSWLRAQPQNLSVVRSAGGLDAFVFHAVHGGQDGPPVPPPAEDPVTAAALDFVAATAPARPGEYVSVARFIGGRHENERDPYAVVVGSVSSTLLWTSQPLAWSFVATTDPEFWEPIFDYLALTTVLTATYDGLDYTLFGVDWRRLTPERWFELMGERELSGESGPAPARLLRPAPLSRAAFGEAVKAALQNLRRPDLLGASPLIGSRLAADPSGPSQARLRDVLVAGVRQLGRDPRTAPLGRVLDRTYVRPAPTQEAAAEVLDLPFSTYRRHLSRGLDRLTELLWSVEIGATGLRVEPARGEQEVSSDRPVG